MKPVAHKQAAYKISYLPRLRAGTAELAGLVAGLCRVLDKVAGLCIVGTMLVVVVNVVLRAAFGSPLLGTYDYVGFLTASAIGLAVAYCAVQKGHIAIGFVADRLPPKLQAAAAVIVNAAGSCFWALAAWHVWQYGSSVRANNLVAPTSQLPIYPFVYLVAAGLFALSLVLLVKLAESIQRTAAGR